MTLAKRVWVQVLRLLVESMQNNAIRGGESRKSEQGAQFSTLYKYDIRCRTKPTAAHTVPYGAERLELVRGELTHRTAAPEGGALTARQRWVRGCLLIPLISLSSQAVAQDVPSGQTLSLNEVLVDTVGTEAWLRFRFLAPDIARDAGRVTYTQAEPDFAVLCDAVARPYLVEYALEADVVVISLMDRPVPFGQADPDATQFFETFRIEGDTCVWQAF